MFFSDTNEHHYIIGQVLHITTFVFYTFTIFFVYKSQVPLHVCRAIPPLQK